MSGYFGGGGASVGGAVTGGTEGSVLFLGAAGVLAQDNANFSRTAAQFKFKTITEHTTNGAVLFEFNGDNPSYTNGLVIRSTSATGYFPNHIAILNSGYGSTGYLSVNNSNGMEFSAPSAASWRFSVKSISGGAMSAKINGSTSAVANEGVFNADLGYAGQVGLRLKLAASPTADVIQVFASDDTTKRSSITPEGYFRFGLGTAVASATALPIPVSQTYHVTGTTTITSITSTGLQSGLTITLIFDGALTFTDGNNLKLAGDFVTTADDTITLAYDGTNWYEVCRSVN